MLRPLQRSKVAFRTRSGLWSLELRLWLRSDRREMEVIGDLAPPY
jgi:hypothetical protein